MHGETVKFTSVLPRLTAACLSIYTRCVSFVASHNSVNVSFTRPNLKIMSIRPVTGANSRTDRSLKKHDLHIRHRFYFVKGA